MNVSPKDNKAIAIVNSPVKPPESTPANAVEYTEKHTSTQKASVYTSIQTTEKQTEKHSCRECLSTGTSRERGVNPPVNISINDLDKITYPLCIRVPVSYKLKYNRLGHREKQLFKIAVLGVLEALSSNGKVSEDTVMGTMVYNININVNQAESKPTVNLNIDLDMVKDLLKEIEEMLRNYTRIAYTDNEKLRYRILSRKINMIKQLIRVN